MWIHSTWIDATSTTLSYTANCTVPSVKSADTCAGAGRCPLAVNGAPLLYTTRHEHRAWRGWHRRAVRPFQLQPQHRSVFVVAMW